MNRRSLLPALAWLVFAAMASATILHVMCGNGNGILPGMHRATSLAVGGLRPYPPSGTELAIRHGRSNLTDATGRVEWTTSMALVRSSSTVLASEPTVNRVSIPELGMDMSWLAENIENTNPALARSICSREDPVDGIEADGVTDEMSDEMPQEIAANGMPRENVVVAEGMTDVEADDDDNDGYEEYHKWLSRVAVEQAPEQELRPERTNDYLEWLQREIEKHRREAAMDDYHLFLKRVADEQRVDQASLDASDQEQRDGQGTSGWVEAPDESVYDGQTHGERRPGTGFDYRDDNSAVDRYLARNGDIPLVQISDEENRAHRGHVRPWPGPAAEVTAAATSTVALVKPFCGETAVTASAAAVVTLFFDETAATTSSAAVVTLFFDEIAVTASAAAVVTLFFDETAATTSSATIVQPFCEETAVTTSSATDEKPFCEVKSKLYEKCKGGKNHASTTPVVKPSSALGITTQTPVPTLSEDKPFDEVITPETCETGKSSHVHSTPVFDSSGRVVVTTVTRKRVRRPVTRPDADNASNKVTAETGETAKSGTVQGTPVFDSSGRVVVTTVTRKRVRRPVTSPDTDKPSNKVAPETGDTAKSGTVYGTPTDKPSGRDVVTTKKAARPVVTPDNEKPAFWQVTSDMYEKGKGKGGPPATATSCA